MNAYSSHVRIFLIILSIVSLASLNSKAAAQSRPAGRNLAIVIDERLSVLRASPDLSGKLLRRIGRGRSLNITGVRRSRDGVFFYSVTVTRRTRGWIQREAVIVPRRSGDDERLLRLIEASADFDRLARAHIFLEAFPHSHFRPRVLLIFGDAAEKAAIKLSQEAARRLNLEEMQAARAPLFSYALNYAGLDRYNRQGVRFVFDREQQKLHYQGASWREIIRRYPKSAEASEARSRLAGILVRTNTERMSVLPSQ
jgi:hypothetical protein